MTVLTTSELVPPLPGTGPTDYTISGMFTTTNWDFADINIVATGIDAEDIVIDGASYTITVPKGWSGTVTPTKAGFIMDPVDRAYTDVTADITGENYIIKKDVNPEAPAITSPTPGQIFNWTEAQTVTATWTAPTGFAPEYYEVKFGATDWVSVNQDLSWTTPALGTGDYTFEVRGVINTPQAKSYVPVVARATDRANNNTTRGNGTAASVNFQVIVAVPTFELAITSTPAGAAILLGGIATGNVTPYTVEAAGTYAVELAGYTFLPEDYVWDGLANASIEFVGTEIPTYDVDPDLPVEIDANTDVTVSGPGFVGGNIITGEDYTPVPNASFIPTSEGILQLVGTGMVDIVFNFDPAVAWFVYMTGGSWIAVEGPLTTCTVTVDLGAKDATLEFKTGTGEDPTLPVELSVFNAVYTAENFVKLSWITESETNMLGYRVYRAESPVQAEAILITPTMIEATNTSTTQSYNHADYEVEGGHTYYYWLEAVDYSHSSFFGYRAVEVTVNTTPELPEVSAMKSAYPNPFRANSKTNIEVSVKAGETGTVTIYNVLGQVVKTYKVTEGTQIIDWNGRDNKGNACGSGIYFYKMSTPSKNITKKMVIVK
ncbi:MAG TPA: T9SS type A sorting domain-containing protein [Candidatus Cloacimonadota bacterium]|nr:T9SS type A sorting domain-containing protein [Candidatus Cloacimonadota bacterium]